MARETRQSQWIISVCVKIRNLSGEVEERVNVPDSEAWVLTPAGAGLPRRQLLPMLKALLILLAAACIAAPAAAADTPPLLVGGHAHGAENIRILSDLGLGNFVWIPKQGYGMGNTPWDAGHTIMDDVDACVEHGLSFMISQRRGLGTEFKPGGGEFGGDTTPEIHSPEVVREIRKRAGELFRGLHAEELDTDLVQNGLRASSRSRIPHIYDFDSRAGGRQNFEAELQRIADIYHGYGEGIQFWPNLCVTLHHSGFRTGGDLVMAEFLESLPNTELQLAYLRGGSRQFDKPWGVWVSPWHGGLVPAEDKDLWPGPNSAVGKGHDASRFRRALYLAWISGARVLTMQETEPLFSRREGGGYQLAAWGRVLKSFWDYVKQHQGPVEPVVQMALMVDANSGWTPAYLHGDWIDHQTLWGKLPVERSDTMLAQYLDALLPGFERFAGWWKPEGYEYPGYFAPSPAGPFDIVSSDISLERLDGYPVVALMGEVAMTPELLERLKLYVSSGGNLLLNVNHMRLKEAFVQDPEFLGAEIGQSRQWSEWSQSNLLMRKVVGSHKVVRKMDLPGVARDEWDEEWFVSQDVQVGDAEVAAVDASGNPVLLKRSYGEGTVWLSTPDFLLSGTWTDGKRLEFFADFLKGWSRLSPVQVTAPESDQAPPDVSWAAGRQGSDVLIALANHAGKEQQVEVAWASAFESGTVDVGQGEVRLEQGRASAVLRIPPKDVAVVRFRGKG